MADDFRSHNLDGCQQTSMVSEDDTANKRDPLREPPLRYLGYANEVGEAFRAQLHVNWVRLSYGVASSYVVADAIHKGMEASKTKWTDEKIKSVRVRWAVVDTLIWQGLASVIIPGFTINRICALSNLVLRTSKLAQPVQKWTTTAVGLMCIPFIIKPIDHSVDLLMESTLRKWYQRGPKMDSIITHSRND